MANAGSVGIPAQSGRLMAWHTRDFVVSAALAVALGIFWVYVWGLVWVAGRGLLPQLGLVLDGFYVISGVLVGYVVRRPGAALLGEMLAALIELPLTPFGPVVLLLGLLQGLGVEVVFLATGYKRYSLPVLMTAGAVGAVVAFYGYDYASYGYASLAPGIQALNLVLKIVGGAVLAGWVGKLIGDALAQTGVLNNFPIGQARRQAI